MAFARLQLRGDTAANWTAANPVLAERELAVETDTHYFKIGDGITAWNSLAYGGIQGIAGPVGPSYTDYGYACSDETTALTTGVKITDRAPRALTITSVKASLTTASSSGLVTIDIKKNGTSIFSTMLTINASATTSVGATTPYVLTSTSFVADDVITISITGAGTGAKGLKVHLLGTV